MSALNYKHPKNLAENKNTKKQNNTKSEKCVIYIIHAKWKGYTGIFKPTQSSVHN